MSFEGLWCLQTTSVHNPGAFEAGGVVVLETGRVLGGDGIYSYIGDYTVNAGTISASVRVRQWNAAVHAVNVFGMVGPVDYMVALTGQRTPDNDNIIVGQLSPVEAPHLALPIRMFFMEPLP